MIKIMGMDYSYTGVFRRILTQAINAKYRIIQFIGNELLKIVCWINFITHRKSNKKTN